MPQGFIVRLVSERGFGFIRSFEPDPDIGTFTEWFFHRSQVEPLTGYDRLRVKDHVEFEEEAHDKGPRAVNVRRV